MTIEVKIIKDSISAANIRLTTLQLRYPKFIHGEFMTHRVFSRNASSSRAIPVERMIKDIKEDPVIPVYWGSNKPGMQAGTELTGLELQYVKDRWNLARDEAIYQVRTLMKLGLHKQLANRLLEPWAHINVVASATDWDNFFALRRHPDAQPEIKVLADMIWEEMQQSNPVMVLKDFWHLPYLEPDFWSSLPDDCKRNAQDMLALGIKCSVARCARVSYMTHEMKTPTVEEDLRLYERLVGAHPMHASPAEHQATPDPWEEDLPNWGNFRGWTQYRKLLPGENIVR